LSIREWLTEVGLPQYVEEFEANEVSVDDLCELTAADLKADLGVRRLVHRKRILAAIEAMGAEESAAVSYPGGLEPDSMPTFVAHPWACLCSEDHPRIKLHWLVDTAELAVRWTVAVALADIVRGSAGTLPESVATALREHIERPTLGRWLAILRALSAVGGDSPELVAPAALSLSAAVFEPAFCSERAGGSLESSLLVLRNAVAHGGGMSRSRAQALLDVHLPRLVTLLTAVRDAMGGVQVVAREGAQTWLLVGRLPTPCSSPPPLPADATGAWIVADGAALPLEPLATFGPVWSVDAEGRLEQRPGDACSQLYARGGRDRLTFTPFGRDEARSDVLDVEAFRSLLQLDRAVATRAQAAAGSGGFEWDDFLREARVLSEDLVGRADELRHIKAWLKSRAPREPGCARVGWISAGPGVGKSMVMARLAADYGGGRHRGLYLHCFRGGDARNNRRSLLRLLQAALWDWGPLSEVTEPPTADASDGRALLEDVKARLGAVEALVPNNERAPAPSFWVFVDGLDEAMASDPELATLVRTLALPGTVWLVAGRPDHGLDDIFQAAGCDLVFAQGLPPMHAADIRAMLLEGLGAARYDLLRRDEDCGEQVHNTFVERVVSRAHGLPLYVQLLLEDLGAGRLSVRDEDKLPDGLAAYYDALVGRLGISTAKADLTDIICLLARAQEPLDEAGLALLLGGPARLQRYLPRVQAALRVGTTLLRRAPSPDTAQAWTLYHQSFREYVGGVPASEHRPGTEPAVALVDKVRDAEDMLADAAQAWATHDAPELAAVRKHLFRWGTEYALWWQGAAGVRAARERLTDFAYLQARTAALDAWESTDLAAEYAAVLARLSDDGARAPFRLWEAFMRERVHMLRRGDQHWPANRILLQCAVEHADDSPVSLEAERWLDRGGCDWTWLRRARRPARAAPRPCVRVFEGHTDWVRGARVYGSRVLSRSDDHTVRVWDLDTGEAVSVLRGHSKHIRDAVAVDGGRVLSWSNDGTLRLWDAESGEPLEVLGEHTSSIYGAVRIAGGRVVSSSRDHTLRVWDERDGRCLFVLKGHSSPVWDALELPDGRLLSWSSDNTLRLWAPQTFEPLAVLTGHQGGVRGALELPDGRLLSWSSDHTLRVWDLQTAECLAVLEGHTDKVDEAWCVDERRVLSWAKDDTLRLWDPRTGECVEVLDGHTDKIRGALVLDRERLLSWSIDETLRLWSARTGEQLAVLDGHADEVVGALPLGHGRLLSWAEDNTLRLWDLQRCECLGTLEGHSFWVKGAQAIDGQQVLSWSNDGTLRLWDTRHVRADTELDGHTHWVWSYTLLDDGRLLSWSSDTTLRAWSASSGECLALFGGHTAGVRGVHQLGAGRLLSWSADGTLRLWDAARSTTVTTFRGHSGPIGGVLRLGAGRCLSWSDDGTARLWDEATGECLFVFAGHEATLTGALRLADQRLLTWSEDRTLRIWDLNRAQAVAVLAGHSDAVVGALPLSDGRLVSWSDDSTLRIWQVAGAAEVAVLEGHGRAVQAAQLLANGHLLSRSRDQTLRVWDSTTGEPLALLEGHDDLVHGALQLADGRILSWTADKTLRLWDADTGAALGSWPTASAARLAPELWAAYCARAAASDAPTWLVAASSGATIRALLADGRSVSWHGDGILFACRHVTDGVVVACCASDLILAQLYEGARRLMGPSSAGG